MSGQIQRTASGHFLPGQSANPGGRSGSLTAVREKLKVHIDVYVAELVRLMGDADPEIRLAALREYGDRLMGKPEQATTADVRSTTFDATSFGLAYIEALKAAQPPKEPVDVTPKRDEGKTNQTTQWD